MTGHSKKKCTFCKHGDKRENDCTVMTDGVVRNLRLFDAIDYDGFNYHKDFELVREIHTPDVVVTYPDGHQTHGIDDHIATLDAFFVLAPDLNIPVHLLTVGSGDLSAQLSYFQGTVDPAGATIIPGAVIGNKFRVRFATFNVWNKEGSFPIEKLVWDNQAFVAQVTDPNQPDFPTPDFLPTSSSDSANLHTATYFQVPYSQKEVECNLKRLRRFYKLVNQRRFDDIADMVHETVSFVKSDGIFSFREDRLIEYLRTLELPSTVTSYTWEEPSLEPIGSRDWTGAVGIIRVCTADQCTVAPDVPPVVFPATGNSPIPMATFIRWHCGKISEIQMLWDNAAILSQLQLGFSSAASVSPM